MLDRRTVVGAALSTAALSASRARAQEQVLKLGVLNDMSGPYRNSGGPGAVACARLAAQLAAGMGLRVEIVAADHQNRPDVGMAIARQWFDRDGVDAIMDFQNSAIALAVAGLAREKDKICMPSSGTSLLTGAQCTPNTVHWCYDTNMLARVVGEALVAAGGDKWFFVTADYAFGHALEGDTIARVRALGGQVVGTVRTPFPNTDFSSALLRAQSSGAKVIALANAGGDTINAIKQAAEFGIGRRNDIRVAALLLQISDVHAIGVPAAQGLALSETFYWNLNDRTRRFTAAVQPAMGGAAPTAPQAACYAATVHYMKAAASLGAAEAKRSGRAVVERMKAMPADDDAFGASTVRADGRVLHTAYLFQVKKPEDVRTPWDYYEVVATVAGENAFRPLSESGCPFASAG